MAARHVAIGQPVHEAEAHGIRILVSALPDSYVVYTNVELPTGRPGQTLEHDAVVIAPHGVYTVELKSWGGRIQGNRDRWTLADGTPAHLSPRPSVGIEPHAPKLVQSHRRRPPRRRAPGRRHLPWPDTQLHYPGPRRLLAVTTWLRDRRACQGPAARAQALRAACGPSRSLARYRTTR